MALTAIPVPGKTKSQMLCDAFIAGAPRDARGFVIYGIKDSNLDAWKKSRATGLPFYSIDGSYFDSVRGQQFRVTKNAFQVQGARKLQSDGKRFAGLGLKVEPYRVPADGYYLAVEQSEVFMRLTAGEPKWLERQVEILDPRYPVKVRCWSRNKLKIQSTLADDLAGARMLVTHSSAAAVTATLAGVPTCVSECHALYNMAWSERQHYLNALADNQWTIAEMQHGEAYRWLNR